jgi:hypothetical protein
MWFDSDAPPSHNGEVRHEARQDDRLSSYGWLRHDGVGYGVQQLRDRDYNITLSMASGAMVPGTDGVMPRVLLAESLLYQQVWWPTACCPQLLQKPTQPAASRPAPSTLQVKHKGEHSGRGGDWAVRIEASRVRVPDDPPRRHLSLVFYMAEENWEQQLQVRAATWARGPKQSLHP